MGPADSAGQPWAGRTFDAHPDTFAGDDGTAPEILATALARFHERAAADERAAESATHGHPSPGLLTAQAAVIDAVRDARLLVPLLAHAGETGLDEHGRTIDKTQELSLVTVLAPDGRTALPAFTSTAAMSRWNPTARPIPTPARRVALAAAGEGTDLVILDPTSPTEFAIRRPALWAIAQAESWMSPLSDPAVAEAFARSAVSEPSIQRLGLRAGDPGSRLVNTELIVELTLVPGLDRHALDAVVANLQQQWGASEVIARSVDSLSLKLLQGT